MAVYSVHHKTTYRYKRPIRPGPHQLLFRPRDSFDQHLLDCRLGVTPEPSEIRWIHDVFDNCLTLVDFNTKCELLEFETFIRLEHTPENAPDFRIEDYARSHPFSYSDDEAPDLAAYINRAHAQYHLVLDDKNLGGHGGLAKRHNCLAISLRARLISPRQLLAHGFEHAIRPTKADCQPPCSIVPMANRE